MSQHDIGVLLVGVLLGIFELRKRRLRARDSSYAAPGSTVDDRSREYLDMGHVVLSRLPADAFSSFNWWLLMGQM
jgi:hypothetical protein